MELVFIVGGGGGVGLMESIWDWNYNFIHFHWNSSGHLWKSCDFSLRVTCLGIVVFRNCNVGE